MFVSGLLVSYILLGKLDRNGGKLELGSHYLHRYLRYIIQDMLVKLCGKIRLQVQQH